MADLNGLFQCFDYQKVSTKVFKNQLNFRSMFHFHAPWKPRFQEVKKWNISVKWVKIAQCKNASSKLVMKTL